MKGDRLPHPDSRSGEGSDIDPMSAAIPPDLKERLSGLGAQACEASMPLAVREVKFEPSGLIGDDDDRGLYRPSGRRLPL